MQQLEIKFFFPLTEQNELDLDYKPCLDYAEEQRKKQLYSGYNFNTWLPNGAVLTTNGGTGTVAWAAVDPTYQHFQVLPDGAVGFWQITPNMSVGRKTKPKLLHRIYAKLMLGWEWKDK